MMQQPPPGGILPHHVPPPSAQQHYGYQQPSPYGMAGAPPPHMWNPQAVAPPSTQPTTADEIRTLWIGDLQFWMDEAFLYGCFAHTGEVVSAKVIRNKQTNQVEGYGFIEFVSHAAAERALQTFNNTPIPNIPDQLFRLNWASLSSGDKRDDSPDHMRFDRVGSVPGRVSDPVAVRFLDRNTR
ncbi:unnamed protein product [Microthlaspi erraticum]|uniref:RRM domain-containing protein n=1 Tax=Microthlaspi erraticum TaxID=1685480 RepID=A0A6D2KF09_9BRAS|nr:unnamed protein product [Microthlaspi erraticum]